MVLFHSMQSVTMWTIAIVIALVWFGSGKQPIAVATSFAQTLWRSRPFLIAFVGLIGVLLINKWELSLEQQLQISWDFTPNIYALEGQFVYAFQQLFTHPLLTTFVAFFYLIVFQGLIVASIGIYTANGHVKMAQAVCYAIIINYIIAIPFYILFPVNEVWAYPPAGVRFLMLDAFPLFEESYRAYSGLNNCLPSLHTSISVTVALLAMQSGNRRWAIFSVISAAIIIFSIFYLGIHWLTDMLAGVALGSLAAWGGMRLAGLQPAWLGSLPKRTRQKALTKAISDQSH
ncbi:phosphatase PAP2 family protein [Paenibacillus sp. 481]|uniref:phosphatase PAP2 family protein n=1 Tax=Paenibacillus sp. 481 TaxID=2835869 RepID=UPI001E5C8CC9|nr:phosphatase PAP2 family protein [Paenibacillus sp. 481]UHA74330.1 phosphatase PAP2 family protein [Paenibacillus sp. 481]